MQQDYEPGSSGQVISMKTSCFVASDAEDAAVLATSKTLLVASHKPEREPVQIMVVGSAKGIESIVHALYAKGYAHISEWSRLMPYSPGKLMRVLTRYVRLD